MFDSQQNYIQKNFAIYQTYFLKQTNMKSKKKAKQFFEVAFDQINEKKSPF